MGFLRIVMNLRTIGRNMVNNNIFLPKKINHIKAPPIIFGVPCDVTVIIEGKLPNMSVEVS